MSNFDDQITVMPGFLYRTGRTLLPRILFPVLLSAGLTTLLPPVILAQQSSIKFNLVEGVGEVSIGKITGITQDPLGYMWFADQDKSCITRYDGYTMVSYKNDPSNSNSLGGSYPECIFADPAGTVWVGFYGMGLDRFDPHTGTFTHYRHDPRDPGSLSNDSVTAILVDRLGKIWVANYGGLDLLDPKTGKFTHFRHDPNDKSSLSNNRIRALYEDRNGDLWIGCGLPWELNNTGGLNRFNRTTQTFTRYLNEPGNPHSLINNKVRAIFEDSRGTFWVGTSGDGLHTLDRSTGKFTRYLYDPKRPGKLSRPPLKSIIDHITFIGEYGSGSIWIGTFESGISRYDPEKDTLSHYGNDRDYPDNSGWQSYTSREGILWLSNQENNLYRVDPMKKNFSLKESGVSMNAFAEDSFKTAWAAMPAGLLVIDKKFKKYAAFPPTAPTMQSFLMSLKKGAGNTLWVCSGGLLYQYNITTEKLVPIRTGIKGRIGREEMLVTSLQPDGEGKLWLGTEMGMYLWDRSKASFRKYYIDTSANDLRDITTVASVYKDKQDSIWAGCYFEGGLYVFNPKTDLFEQRLNVQSVLCIFEDSNSTMWVGTTNGLYFREKNHAKFQLLKMAGTPVGSAEILGITEDKSGRLWVSSKSGIFKLNDHGNKINWYGSNQGLNPITFTRAILTLSDGMILVGCTVGYYVFDPDLLADNVIPAQIIFRDLKISDKLVTPGNKSPLSLPMEMAGTIRLRYDQDIFSIGFAGIHYTNPLGNSHLYKLEGYDPEYRRAGSERTAYYFNVPPGKYVFKVKVSNSEEIWSEKSINVTIFPAWWTTWYFKTVAVLMLIGALYGLIRWRMRRLYEIRLRKSETEKQLADLKHKSAMLEMQALRSQMNPHFIFNSLNSINRFILQSDKAKASEYLTKFSRLIRLILQHSEHSQVTLENELQALQLYLELEAVRFDHQFDYQITVEDDVDTSVIKVPPLIFQPYAENAIWHGLMHKEEKGLLEIQVKQVGNLLICRIRDNGIGRQQAKRLNSKSASQHKSMGMKITAGRIEMLRSNDNDHANVTVHDLVLADGTAGGTEVIIKIPVSYD